jgi:hypothetical protein
MDTIADELNIQTQHDWYSVDIEGLISKGKIFPMVKRGQSVRATRPLHVITLLEDTYNEFTWYPFLFEHVPRYFICLSEFLRLISTKFLLQNY